MIHVLLRKLQVTNSTSDTPPFLQTSLAIAGDILTYLPVWGAETPLAGRQSFGILQSPEESALQPSGHGLKPVGSFICRGLFMA